MSVYRSLAAVDKNKETTSGLIISSNIHKCKLPGFWIFLWCRLTGNKITNKSLWRCDECGNVYMHTKGLYGDAVYDCNHPCMMSCNYWRRVKIKDWTAMGGAE